MTDNNLKDDQIEVEVEIDKADEPEVSVEPVEKVIAPEDGIADLKRQLDAERAMRAEAERRAQEAAQQVHLARNEVEDTNLHLVKNAIDTVKRNNDLLKMEYRDAMATGDYDRAADIQQTMSSNAAKLLQLENGRRAMEEKPKAPPPPPVTDHVEALAAQVTPASAQWLRQNKQHLGNESAIRRMFRAHEDAIDEGIVADTPEYFGFIEDRLKISKPVRIEPEADPMLESAKVTQRRSAPPAAPVSRSGAAPGSNPKVVRLTAAEREMASMMGMTEQEYARNKIALQKEGKL